MDVGFPLSTLKTLYRTNVRILLLYGTALLDEVEELEKLDRRLVQKFIKRLLYLKKDITGKLLDRLCIRIRLPSLMMELGKNAKNWKKRLASMEKTHAVQKVRTYAADTLPSINRLP